MKTPGSRACSCMRIRSPSSAPLLKVDDGSTASTATFSPFARNCEINADVDVDFPTPGGPVRPTMWAVGVGIDPSNSAEPAPAFSTRVTRWANSRMCTLPASPESMPLDYGYGVPALHGTRMSNASPWPPPPHSAAAPIPPPRRRNSYAKCKTSRAPEAPIG
jgi:hypothetical protein